MKGGPTASEEQIKQALDEVLIPGIKRDLTRLNMVREVAVSAQRVNITLASTALSADVQDWVSTKTKAVVEKLPDVEEVDIEFVEITPAELNQIGNIIAVMSGKGGVGKSLVASLMAVALKRQGYEVGVLDADITGPSIPKMFGIEDDAVIWRGPLISKAITQFWEDVVWGKLDYLIIDLPPGTADASLTVMQTLPISGVIIVFTPQDLTTMIVKKTVSMAQKMDKPVLGVVENMSYLYVPEIDKRIELFGKSRGEEMAQAARAPFLGQLPIDPELAKICDEGGIERYNSDAFTAMARTLIQTLPQAISA